MLNWIRKIFGTQQPANYIVWDRTNNMWDDGHLSVYLNGHLHETIYLSEGDDDDWVNPYDIIDSLKEKYSISEVNIIEGPNWR